MQTQNYPEVFLNHNENHKNNNYNGQIIHTMGAKPCEEIPPVSD